MLKSKKSKHSIILILPLWFHCVIRQVISLSLTAAIVHSSTYPQTDNIDKSRDQRRSSGGVDILYNKHIYIYTRYYVIICLRKSERKRMRKMKRRKRKMKGLMAWTAIVNDDNDDEY